MKTIELQFADHIFPTWDWKDRETLVPSTITDIHATHQIEGVGVVSQVREEWTREKKLTTIVIQSFEKIE